MELHDITGNENSVSAHKFGFFLCMAGEAKILLGHRIYDLSRYTLCIYTPNSYFQIMYQSEDLDGIVESIDVDDINETVNKVNLQNRLIIRNSPCINISSRDAEDFVELYNVLHKNDCKSTQSQNGVLDNIALELAQCLRATICVKVFELYFKNCQTANDIPAKDTKIFDRFIMDLYKNCHSQRTVQYYADRQHLSPYYFSNIIRAQSGMGALQWIASVTMNYAKQYLLSQDMSIKEIAERLNFPDQSSFGRFFKQHEGCTATQFRTSHRRSNRIDLFPNHYDGAGSDKQASNYNSWC